MVPHSHDDVGWRNTVDEYYYTRVDAIITSVIECLIEDPKRKFSYVEMKYLAMWTRRQTDKTIALVKQLVENGQLELINGGWSMHDEATPTYQDMINNMMKGHNFIN